LTGLSASVVRACIMGGLTLWGLRAGQNVNFWKVLLFCIVVMGVWNPAFIYYDVSFHLSILATLGVVIGGKFVNIEADKDFVGLKEAFYMTVFAQIFTTPLVILKFDYLSIVSPLANVLVAPLLPILMFLGSFLVLIEFLFPFEFVNYLIVFIIEIFSRVFFEIVALMSQLDFLVIDLETINRDLWVGIYLLSFVLLLVFLSKGNSN
jgi:competence protein ComEC